MKKIFSFVVVLAAVAMVGCAGNSNKKAAEVLGWKPVLGLDQIVSDAWAWHSGHPNGYEG